MSKQYSSVYGYHIEQYISIKKKLGFKFITEARVLDQVDRLADLTNQTSAGIARKFADLWGKRRSYESDFYRYTRIRILAAFSTYLCDIGIRSYIPKLPTYRPYNYIPYIYSTAEIMAIIKACDELRLKQVSMSSSLFALPALIRVLYGTGLRIGEALSLKNDDVNLDDSYLRVRDSKNGKERIIPISDSLTSVCRQYARYRSMLPLREKPIYFFIGLDGRKCGYQSIKHWFGRSLNLAGIRYISNNNRPRIHDLRHTFAVNSLATMSEAGIDLYASLPILSNYLGHQSLEGTNHYVRLTASMYPDLLKDVDQICLDVFPKFNNYETD